MSRSLGTKNSEYTIGVRARKLPGARLHCLRSSSPAVSTHNALGGKPHINRADFEKKVREEKNNKRISLVKERMKRRIESTNSEKAQARSGQGSIYLLCSSSRTSNRSIVIWILINCYKDFYCKVFQEVNERPIVMS